MLRVFSFNVDSTQNQIPENSSGFGSTRVQLSPCIHDSITRSTSGIKVQVPVQIEFPAEYTHLQNAFSGKDESVEKSDV